MSQVPIGNVIPSLKSFVSNLSTSFYGRTKQGFFYVLTFSNQIFADVTEGGLSMKY
uniref:Uncharacterized protein n=1 Tax=Arundo donax TaxID=35708 RepID=A0A0A9U8K0_ARUDO